MKTVRTVRMVVEKNERLKRTPRFGKGDYLEIYSGYREGHCFYVKDMRFNHDTDSFEYLYDGMLIGDWVPEKCLVGRKVKDR